MRFLDPQLARFWQGASAFLAGIQRRVMMERPCIGIALTAKRAGQKSAPWENEVQNVARWAGVSPWMRMASLWAGLA